MKKSTILKIAVFTVVTAVLIYIFHRSNVYAYIKNIFSSTENIKRFILAQGPLAPLTFFIIQIAQIIISPIPGTLTSLAGAAVFGCLYSFLISGVATMLGSIMAFMLARIVGRRLVVKLIGESVLIKYEPIFQKNFAITLLLIYVLPFLPDDAICFLAGLSKIPLKLYILILFIGRLPGVFFTSAAGSNVLNLSITQWIIIGIPMLIIVLLYARFRGVIEAFINTKLGIE